MKAGKVIFIFIVSLFFMSVIFLDEDDNDNKNSHSFKGVIQNSVKSKFEAAVPKIRSKALQLKEERLQRQLEIQRLKLEERIQKEQLNKDTYKKDNKQLIGSQNKIKANPNSNQTKWMQFNASYYGSDCTGCSGITATGINVRETIHYNGLRIVAVDPTVIPLGTIVEINTPYESFRAISADTGGAIKGYKLDILVESERVATRYGRHNVQLRVVEYSTKITK
ncbi:SPBc2 prophage-derived protein YorM [Lysinibacillus sphaericus OT4b.31]|uniref:SPBc2 prophage-derived protein YorM n=1 Tax=Lysinibacillus sphaericus OT4b.31 TaxID=1285586 RepID=R7ZFQ6_LYSSH|nr:SPBc2 prophage-derived protein YorM [Lysinibacillus sphaericus OT4b.31]